MIKPETCILLGTTITSDSVLDCSVIFSGVSISPNETSTVTVNSLFIDPIGVLSMDYNDVIIARNDVVLGGVLNIDATGYTTNFTIIKSENGTISGTFTNGVVSGFDIVYTYNRVILMSKSDSIVQAVIVATSIAAVCLIFAILGVLWVRRRRISTANPIIVTKNF